MILSCALLLFLARPTLVAAIQVDPGEKTRNELPTQIHKNVGGDFDVLKKRRAIRVLVVYNKTNFFIDKGQPRGITYEGFKLFEDELNKKYKTGECEDSRRLCPVGRADLEQALLTGRGDIVAANVTVTPERLERVDFSSPVMTNVSEIVVSGPSPGGACERRRPFRQGSLCSEGVHLPREPGEIERRPR